MFKHFIGIFLCIYLSTAYAQEKKFVLPSELKEVSGLYIADSNDFWWHNDGGNEAALYRTDGKGCPKEKIRLPEIKNIDWEEITHDTEGNIYICDFGNNRNNRQDLKIYIYNPTTNAIDSILFNYSDQRAFPPQQDEANFDMEGAFWHQDSLHLFSKNRLSNKKFLTKHYVLPAVAGTHTALLRNSITLKKRVVTAAAISPDGKRVALLAYNFKRLLGIFPISGASVFLISDFSGTNFLDGQIHKIGTKSFIFATQFESLDWLNDEEIYIASEQTVFIKPKAKRLHVK